MRKVLIISLAILLSLSIQLKINSAEKVELMKTDWTFKGLLGKFDRASLQRGYQVYTEVCAACHSMKYISYRNLMEKGGPEFSEAHCRRSTVQREHPSRP